MEFCFIPYCWAKFLQASKSPSHIPHGEPVVFCHELRSPSGKRRLVAIGVYHSYMSLGAVLLEGFQIAIYDHHGLHILLAPLLNKDTSTDAIFPGPSLIEAGQFDPTDASHFTIGYKWPDGVGGIIDGWLQDDDTVKLSIRPGPGDVKSAEERYSKH